MAFSERRICRLGILFFILACLLIGRLAYLQLVAGGKLAVMALEGRIQEVPVEVARGEIYDRNGQPLTNTALHFSIAVFPGLVEDRGRTAGELSLLTGLEKARVEARLTSGGPPFKLKSDVDAVTAQRINSRRLPGVMALPERVRYGSSSLAAHVVGYINAADNRGVSGVEGTYDEVLRGSQSAYLAALVDAGQNLIPGLGYKRLRPEGGGPSDIILTLDSRVQKVVERVMDDKVAKGAVVVIRPSTGEVLAMASRPSFNANELDGYLGRSSSPLLNRAVSAYQPGSVFKLAVAAAALEEKLAGPTDLFFDPGFIEINGLRFQGWDYEQGPRGRLTFLEAMAHSSNPVLIEVGLRLGAERLVRYADKLGFGRRTGLNLDGEAEGNLPPPVNLFSGDLANLSIGQGALEATPLQVAGMVATIVNDGVKVEPYIVSRITAADGRIVKSFASSRGSRVLSRQTASQLREMMVAVTRFGTGQAAYVAGPGSAGKTGSAETGRRDAAGKSISHAWFAGYAPLDNPRYVVVVFVEDGMSGGDVAAPIFQAIVNGILAGGG
jgi:penicillin-binding protein 2